MSPVLTDVFTFQVQLGEELLANGDITNGVEHLALAVAVCGQPHSLLSVLQQTLPPQIYQVGVPTSVHRPVCLTEIFPPQLLLQNLDGAQSRVRQHASSSMMSSMMRGRPAPGGLEVEDVE